MLSSPRRRRLTALRQQSRRRARSTEPPACPRAMPSPSLSASRFESLTVGFSLAPTSGRGGHGWRLTYDTTTNTATFTPSSALTAGTAYTATVSTAQDAAGNALGFAGDVRLYDSDGVHGSCPCSLWSDATVPSIPAASDSGKATRAQVAVRCRWHRRPGPGSKRGPATAGARCHVVDSRWRNWPRRHSPTVPTGSQQVTFSQPVARSQRTPYVICLPRSGGPLRSGRHLLCGRWLRPRRSARPQVGRRGSERRVSLPGREASVVGR